MEGRYKMDFKSIPEVDDEKVEKIIDYFMDKKDFTLEELTEAVDS